MHLQHESAHGILGHFLKWESATPDAVFLRQPEGKRWKSYTWKEVGQIARQLAFRLRSLQLPIGSRIAILSQNCAEWVICDIAIMMGGFVSVPIYANVNASTFKDVLLHSEARFLFIGKLVENDWHHLRPEIPPSLITITMQGYEKPSITTWESFMSPDIKKTDIALPFLDNMLTIIYTSGTTGNPKGVVHTVGSIIKAVETAAEMALLDRKGNRFFSYLPLSHAAERGLVEFGCIFSGGTISFADTQETFLTNLRDTLPTHFLGVPRIWEKFQLKILEKLSQEKINRYLKIPVVKSYLKRRIKRSLGLQNATALFSGAAYISPDLLNWYAKLGINIREAYGMSENFNVCSLNPPDKIKIGTVGTLFDHEEVSIDTETKEILQRCEWLMKGYYKDPDLTSKTIINGYLHTGDTGELTADGYLQLTGRIKDIFKTTKGEYVNPLETERQFISMNEIDQVCVLGQQYTQPFIVVVLSAHGKRMEQEKLVETLSSALEDCNKYRMGYQRIKKLIVVRDEWTIENNLLTPTLKIKRNVLALKYEPLLESHFYSKEMVSFE